VVGGLPQDWSLIPKLRKAVESGLKKGCPRQLLCSSFPSPNPHACLQSLVQVPSGNREFFGAWGEGAVD
jgi:hypothetical protein